MLFKIRKRYLFTCWICSTNYSFLGNAKSNFNPRPVGRTKSLDLIKHFFTICQVNSMYVFDNEEQSKGPGICEWTCWLQDELGQCHRLRAIFSHPWFTEPHTAARFQVWEEANQDIALTLRPRDSQSIGLRVNVIFVLKNFSQLEYYITHSFSHM